MTNRRKGRNIMTNEKRAESKRYRLSIDLSEAQFARLEELEKEFGSPKTEVIRSALRLIDFVSHTYVNGDHLQVFDKHDKPKGIKLIPLL